MSRLAGPLAVIGVVLFAIAFASWNGAERVTLEFGLFVFYGVPITLVAFGGLFLGMLVMLGAGVQSDLKVRSILRNRLAEDDAKEATIVDKAQRDLFLHVPPSEQVERDPRAQGHAPEVTDAPTEAHPPTEPWLGDAPSIDDLAPEPDLARPPGEPHKPVGRPDWRDMEHGDPMD